MKIITDSGCGSGFVYMVNNEQVVLVSASHVIDDKDENIYVEYKEGKRIKAELNFFDADKDVAFINVPTDTIDDDTLKLFELLSSYDYISEDKENIDAYVSYIDDDYSVVKTKVFIASTNEFIYDIDRKAMFGNGDIVKGMSGAAIYDTEGRICGIVIASNDDGIFVGTSIRDINRIYDEHKFRKDFSIK